MNIYHSIVCTYFSSYAVESLQLYSNGLPAPSSTPSHQAAWQAYSWHPAAQARELMLCSVPTCYERSHAARLSISFVVRKVCTRRWPTDSCGPSETDPGPSSVRICFQSPDKTSSWRVRRVANVRCSMFVTHKSPRGRSPMHELFRQYCAVLQYPYISFIRTKPHVGSNSLFAVGGSKYDECCTPGSVHWWDLIVPICRVIDSLNPPVPCHAVMLLLLHHFGVDCLSLKVLWKRLFILLWLGVDQH